MGDILNVSISDSATSAKRLANNISQMLNFTYIRVNSWNNYLTYTEVNVNYLGDRNSNVNCTFPFKVAITIYQILIDISYQILRAS